MKNQPEKTPVLSTNQSGRDSGGRWKPGQSGNPAGRPPKAESWSVLFDDELSRLCDVIDGGEKVRVSVKRAIVKLLISKALGEDLRAIREILDRTSSLDQGNDETIDLSEFAELLANNYSRG